MADIEEPIVPTDSKVRNLLMSWWYGLEIKAEEREKILAESAAEAEAQAAKAKAVLPPMSRIELLQAVWGPGYILPGGVNYVLNLVKPFGFNPAMSVLDISIGLGGPAKHIAEKFNIYINGMEADHDIAELGRAAMVKAGLSRRILISDWDPESHELRPRSFDGIYGQHLTLNLYNKERLFAEIKKALKDNGHFTFTDFVLKEGVKHDDPALRPWMSLEPKPVMPWTVQAYIECMTQVGLDCRIFESQAEGYIEHATRGWADYFQSIDLPGMSEENLKTILREATLSNHRVELLKRGLLDVYRFYAIVH